MPHYGKEIWKRNEIMALPNALRLVSQGQVKIAYFICKSIYSFCVTVSRLLLRITCVRGILQCNGRTQRVEARCTSFKTMMFRRRFNLIGINLI